MHTSILRKVGLRPGATVAIGVRSGRLIVEPQTQPRYALTELLAQCNPRAVRTEEERDWIPRKGTSRNTSGGSFDAISLVRSISEPAAEKGWKASLTRSRRKSWQGWRRSLSDMPGLQAPGIVE